jgi:hypothetical protein
MLESERNSPQFYLPLPAQLSFQHTGQKPELETAQTNNASNEERSNSHKVAGGNDLRPSRSKP